MSLTAIDFKGAKSDTASSAGFSLDGSSILIGDLVVIALQWHNNFDVLTGTPAGFTVLVDTHKITNPGAAIFQWIGYWESDVDNPTLAFTFGSGLPYYAQVAVIRGSDGVVTASSESTTLNAMPAQTYADTDMILAFIFGSNASIPTVNSDPSGFTQGLLVKTTAITYDGEMVESCYEVMSGSGTAGGSWSTTNTTAGDTYQIALQIKEGAGCAPPVNTVAPAVTGTPETGQTLTCADGTYTGDPTIVLTKQWYRFCGTGPEELIGGATSPTYVPDDDDVGCDDFCRETATSSCAPPAVTDSNSVGPVTAGPPANITPPTITGVTAAGHLLEGSDGTWSGATSFSEQWYLDCGGGPIAIVGETTDEILTDDTYDGCTLLFGVIAHGPGGDSAEVFSDPFGPIVANVPAARRFYQSPPWRFVVLDLNTFETLSFLDHIATDRSVTYVLNQPAVSTGKVPSNEPEINIPWPGGNDEPFLAEGTRALLGFRREGTIGMADGPWVIRYAGRIEQLEDVAESDNAFTHYTAYDPLRYLMSRPVRNGPDFDYTLPGINGSSYTATRIDVIIGEIIHNTITADGPVGIDLGTLYGGTSFYGGTIEALDHIDINFAQGTTVGEAIQQMTATDKCDVLLLPIYDPLHRPGYLVEMSILAQAGAVIDDAIFAWDRPSRSLTGISRLKDGTTRANEVKFFAGQGGTANNGQNIPVKEDAASKAKYGEYWYQQFWPGQEVADAVESLAETQLGLRKDGRTTVAISPAPQRSPIPFQEYYLGDRVPVYASNRFREPIPPGGTEGIEYQRIYGIPIQIADDETETILQMLTAVQG